MRLVEVDPAQVRELAKLAGESAVVGPTLAMLGLKLRDASEWGLNNVGNVLKAAGRRQRTDDPINPRVLSKALDEALTTDDEVMAEYLGGVLASSASPGGKDDTGVAITAAVGLLSSSALSLHYLLYAHAVLALQGQDLNPRLADSLAAQEIFLPLSAYWLWNGSTDSSTLPHSAYLLLRNQLLGQGLVSGPVEHLRSNGFPNAPEPGVRYALTYAGIELFMWGVGQGHLPGSSFPELALEDIALQGRPLPGRAVRVQELPPTPPAEP